MTFEYIMEKINFHQDYKNLCDKFNELIKDSNINAYSTSYGIGIFRLFGWESSTVDKVKNILDSLNVSYGMETSDAGWVLRFKISKAKSNLEKF
jgi:flavorubredoxin